MTIRRRSACTSTREAGSQSLGDPASYESWQSNEGRTCGLRSTRAVLLSDAEEQGESEKPYPDDELNHPGKVLGEPVINGAAGFPERAEEDGKPKD